MGGVLFITGFLFFCALMTASSQVRSLSVTALWVAGVGTASAGVTYALAQMFSQSLARADGGMINLGRGLGLGLGAWIGSWLGPWLGAWLASRVLLGRSIRIGAILVTGFVGALAALPSTWCFLIFSNDSTHGAGVLVLCNVALVSVSLGIVMLMVDPADEASGDTLQSQAMLVTPSDVGKLAPAVLRQVERLGGVYRRPTPVVPQTHAGAKLPEPIRTFLYDIQWPAARYKGGPLLPGVFMLGFSPVSMPSPSEFGAASACGGSAWLIIRLDSADLCDPFVFIREREGQDGEQLPLSTLLAQLVPDELHLPGSPKA